MILSRCFAFIPKFIFFRKEKLRIWKNLLLICVAFVGNFTAFNGASVLQSSLNADAGLGTASLAVIYGSLILSAMFLPTYGTKTSINLSKFNQMCCKSYLLEFVLQGLISVNIMQLSYYRPAVRRTSTRFRPIRFEAHSG